MRSRQFSHLTIAAIVSMTSIALAGPVGYDPALKEKKLEAGAPCTDGSCFKFDQDGGLSGLEAQVHKINTFTKNGKDPLVMVTKAKAPKELSAIGKIEAAQPVLWPDNNGRLEYVDGLKGTAFLVSPCLVMANYHSVFGMSKSPNSNDFTVKFTANRTVTGKPVAWRRRDDMSIIGKDWALVRLEKNGCLGAEVGFIKMLEEPFSSLKNQKLLTAGYPGKKSGIGSLNDLWVHDGCSKHNGLEGPNFVNTIFNDCATSGGQSGSPLLVRNNSGEIRAIGMQTTELGTRDKFYKKFDSRVANVGIDLISALSFDDLDLIEADMKSQKPNVGTMASH